MGAGVDGYAEADGYDIRKHDRRYMAEYVLGGVEYLFLHLEVKCEGCRSQCTALPAEAVLLHRHGHMDIWTWW